MSEGLHFTESLFASRWSPDAVEAINIQLFFSHAPCPSWHIFSLIVFPQELYFTVGAERRISFTRGVESGGGVVRKGSWGRGKNKDQE